MCNTIGLKWIRSSGLETAKTGTNHENMDKEHCKWIRQLDGGALEIKEKRTKFRRIKFRRRITIEFFWVSQVQLPATPHQAGSSNQKLINVKCLEGKGPH